MLSVVKIDPAAKLPTVAHPGEDLAYDLYAVEDYWLNVEQLTIVRTGIAARFSLPFEPQKKFGLLIRDRSSMAAKGITVSGGVIDAGYTGEIKVLLRMESIDEATSRRRGAFKVNAGDKVAQMIPLEVLTGAPIIEVETLIPHSFGRGTNGFGSSSR